MKATDDTKQDTEPAVIAENDFGGAAHTVTTAIKYTNSLGLITARINAAATTTMAPGSFTRGELPISVDARGTPIYQHTGDPMMSANVYGSGVWPKRMYSVGIEFDAGGDSQPSAIALWSSDDYGITWGTPMGRSGARQPRIVATQNGGGYFVDKPSVAVSYYPGDPGHASTLGHVYVAWFNLDKVNPASSSIWVARSTDGGGTFEAPVVITYDRVQNPVLAVDSNTGDVYCVWVNEANNDIRAAKASGTGSTLVFGPHEIIGGGNLLTSLTGKLLHGGVRAPTVPMIRYNWISRTLMVVWHGGTPGVQSDTNIYYSYSPCTTQCNYWGWQQPRQIDDATSGDQFEPALDYTRYGTAIVTFYDRRNDVVNNQLYQPYFAYINPDGSAIHANMPTYNLQSDPSFHTSGTLGTGDANFIGDYQDAWVWTYPDGDRLVSSWIGIENSTVIGDVFLSRITF
ncbi:MAG: glycoside hydrolase [Acidobacteriota bacterium]|nr:glycoside hydrolase [Acidobacteriota bacterium]